jgi:nicotinamidase-related amidase
MSEWKFKGKPALVVLHMQEGIVGSLTTYNTPGITPDQLSRQQSLLKAFRDRNLTVIYVNVLQSVTNPAGSFPAYGRMFRKVGSYQENPQKLAVIPGLTPLPGEPVLFNWLMGAFTNSGLDQVLKAHNIETVVIFGGALHIAVYHAAVQAVDLWYSVIIPEDACVPTKTSVRTPEEAKVRDVVLNAMFPNIALVTTTEDIITHLET